MQVRRRCRDPVVRTVGSVPYPAVDEPEVVTGFGIERLPIVGHGVTYWMVVGIAVDIALPPPLSVQSTIAIPPPVPKETSADSLAALNTVILVPPENEQPPAEGGTLTSHLMR